MIENTNIHILVIHYLRSNLPYDFHPKNHWANQDLFVLAKQKSSSIQPLRSTIFKDSNILLGVFLFIWAILEFVHWIIIILIIVFEPINYFYHNTPFFILTYDNMTYQHIDQNSLLFIWQNSQILFELIWNILHNISWKFDI